jgi:hypothetical protein
MQVLGPSLFIAKNTHTKVAKIFIGELQLAELWTLMSNLRILMSKFRILMPEFRSLMSEL